MALVKCPDCGNPVSDKAVICPHCGIDVQKVLAEIREEKLQQRKKRKKFILISLTSVFVVGAIIVVAYLYSIDGLNTIPSNYRKATDHFFEQCESAIDKGYFDEGTDCLEELAKRTLTNRQTKRLEEIKKTLVKSQLKDLEILMGLYEANPKETIYFKQIDHIAKNLNNGELSTEQKSKIEDAISNAERIKKQEEDRCHEQLLKTVRDVYIRLIDDCISSSYETGYFLHDIDGDGIPELWIKSGECEADYQLIVYAYANGLRQIFQSDAGHSTFYIYYDGVIQIHAHMGYANWDLLTYDGWKIVSNEMYEEDINGTDHDYSTPNEGKLVRLYSLNNKRPIMDAFSVK